jgi:hypothetical protein
LNLWWKLTKLLPGFSEKFFANLFQSFVSSHVFFLLGSLRNQSNNTQKEERKKERKKRGRDLFWV